MGQTVEASPQRAVDDLVVSGATRLL